jgi:hypothetical protein
MLYAEFGMFNGHDISFEQIGERLELELENLGFDVSVPTSADWGYVFRIKSDGQKFDIYIVPIKGGQFGLAIERVKGLFYEISKYFTQSNIKGLKDWIDDILGTDIGVEYIRWYSAEKWITTFGQNFWKYCNL